jgi:hypothetical protein
MVLATTIRTTDRETNDGARGFAAPVLAPIDTSTSTTTKSTSGYVDPFTSPITPVPPSLSLRTTFPLFSPATFTSPVKLTRHTVPAPASPTPKFDSGFAQIKALAFLLLKMCLFIYAIYSSNVVCPRCCPRGLSNARSAISFAEVVGRVDMGLGRWLRERTDGDEREVN